MELPAPALLIQLQDDLARSRMREAFWISVVVHMLAILGIIFAPKVFPGYHKVALLAPRDLMRDREVTFLEAPADRQKPPKTPDTNVISDKDRIATSRTPELNRKELQEILDSSRAGAPGAPSPPGSSLMAQGAPPSPPGRQSADGPAPNQPPKLETPQMTAAAGGGFGSAMSPGSLIEQAARAAAANRGAGGGASGDYGSAPFRSPSNIRGELDILSDTMGVDFGPYLARVLHDVRENWYTLIPEVARAPMMKKGKVSLEFAILKDGRVAGLRMVGSSTDASLDRAAWGGILASNPFPPLPGEFHGDYLALRFHFYYNPDRNELR